MAIDEWRDIPGWEGMYQVSSSGQVRSLHRKNTRTLKPRNNRKGYPCVMLYAADGSKKNKPVHRLVAATFIRRKDEAATQVNHIDGNKTNNSRENLEWVTASENIIHSVGIGKRAIGEGHHSAKLTESDVVEIRKRLKAGDRQKDIARDFGVSTCPISQIKRGIIWKHVPQIKEALDG